MDFDQLTTFVYVAKLKSFSRAGQKVFRSQSAVSAQIRQLEQAYKARLLDRSAKSVELTPAGVVLFEYAEKLLRMRDESIQVVADRGNVVQGPIVFGANEATCLYLLPDIFAEFQPQDPAAHRGWLRGCRHRHSAHQVAQFEDAPHLQRSPALHGQHKKSLGSSLQDHPRRSRRAAAHLPTHRLHPPGA